MTTPFPGVTLRATISLRGKEHRYENVLPGRSAILCLLAAAALLAAGGCASSPSTETGFYLDTVVRLTVYDGGPDDVHAAMEAVRRYDALFSPSREDSDVSRINAAAGQAVTVDPETAALIRRGLKISALSGGAFDPTVAPVTALWDFTAAALCRRKAR